MTSPEGDRKNVRIRDNQRRSRARKKQQLESLEHRVREYDLTGVRASAEVQHAARRVAEENTQLRSLLRRHGASDEYIAEFLRSGSAPQIEADPVTRMPSGNPSEAVRHLHQVAVPRRLAPLDTQPPLPNHTQASREASTASGSTTSSSFWDSAQPIQPAHTFDPAPPPVPSNVPILRPTPAPILPPQYPLTTFTATQTSHTEPYYPTLSSTALAPDFRRQTFSEATLTSDGNAAPRYQSSTTFPSAEQARHGTNSGYPMGPHGNP